MYCPECGKWNPEESELCEYCGTVFEEELSAPQQSFNQSVWVNAPAERNQNDVYGAPYREGASQAFDRAQFQSDVYRVKKAVKSTANVVSQKAKHLDTQENRQAVQRLANNKMFLPLVCLVVFFIVAVVCFFAVGFSLTKPERIAEKYFECCIEGDYEKMYSYVDITESDFVNKKTFVQYMQNNTDIKIGSVSNYTIQEYAGYPNGFESYGMEADSSRLKDNALIKSYIVRYVREGSGSETTYDIVLTKKKTKKWLFFDNYCVGMNDYLVTDYEIKTCAGARIFMDGIELKNPEQCREEEKWYDSYTIPSAFSGSHEFRVVGSIYDELVCTKALDGDTVVVPTLSDKSMETLQGIGESVIRTVMTGAAAQKDYKDLKLSDKFGRMESFYDEIKNNFSDKKCKSIKISKVELDDSDVEEFITLLFRVTYTYTYQYEDWYSGETLTDTREETEYIRVNFACDTENGRVIPISMDD